MVTANQQKFEREKREMEQNHQTQVTGFEITVLNLEKISGVLR